MSETKNDEALRLTRRGVLKVLAGSAATALPNLSHSQSLTPTPGSAPPRASAAESFGLEQNRVIDSNPSAASIVIENTEMRLVIGEGGTAESLLHKPSGQECLFPGVRIPVFTLTQDRPYQNEVQLGYSAKRKIFAANSVRRVNDQLLVKFELVDHVLTIRLKITEDYIGFSIEQVQANGGPISLNGQTSLDEITFLQLPVRARTNFGEWLNVVWDSDVAVNVLATDPFPRIDSEKREGYYRLNAGAIPRIKLDGVGAALITTSTGRLLDRIARVESDFHLPRGVKSRRAEEQKWSYYWTNRVTPQNLEEHIRYAKQAGFRAMVISYGAFAGSLGHFPWRLEYPNHMADLKAVVDQVKKAGMLAGFHLHYNKASPNDAYVSPVPDDRLDLIRTFTLAEPLSANSDTIIVLENPQGSTLDESLSLLKIGKEIVSYKLHTNEPPYQFSGCKRGVFGSHPAAYQKGLIFGLLNVDYGRSYLRFNQETNIQQEVAARLAGIYRDAGFQFVYFDGAEDVSSPYWYTVSKAQWDVYRGLEPEPLLAEAACKSHFSWHMLSRGNAFDVFKPEVMKASTRRFPAAEAVRNAQDFTGLDFGWMGYWSPSEATIGTQPDMVEYLTSRAAAWDCPISIQSNLNEFKNHPRTPDNLEVVRRWEEVRYRHWLTEEQKQLLRNLKQEHILLVNEKKEFELVPYDQIEGVAGGSPAIRAFLFQRASKTFVVFWHTSGSAGIEVPLPAANARLLEELGGKGIQFKKNETEISLPATGRLYLECADLSITQIM